MLLLIPPDARCEQAQYHLINLRCSTVRYTQLLLLYSVNSMVELSLVEEGKTIYNENFNQLSHAL